MIGPKTAAQAVKRFRRLEDQSRRLNAVSNHLSDRARQAQERRQRAEIELQQEERALKRLPTRVLGRPGYSRPEPHPELLREVAEARLEHEKLTRDWNAARESWTHAAQLMESCKLTLLDRGITVEKAYMAKHSNVPAYRSNPDMLPAAQRII